MKRFQWTTALFLVCGISAVLLHFVRDVQGFPREVMYFFVLADYIWHELQREVSRGIARTIISNVAVFGILAAAQGALIGLILDLYRSSRRASLKERISRLGYNAQKTNLAFKRRVQEIVTRYDPAGLIKLGLEQDAYAAQTDMILAKINKLRSPGKLEKFCRRVFGKQLGRSAGKFKKYDSLANEIWTAYLQQQRPERRDAPVRQGL